jgi:hypothetical protein
VFNMIDILEAIRGDVGPHDGSLYKSSINWFTGMFAIEQICCNHLTLFRSFWHVLIAGLQFRYWIYTRFPKHRSKGVLTVRPARWSEQLRRRRLLHFLSAEPTLGVWLRSCRVPCSSDQGWWEG